MFNLWSVFCTGWNAQQSIRPTASVVAPSVSISLYTGGGTNVRAVEPMQAWRMHCLAAVSRESFPPLAALACAVSAALACAVAVWNATILLWLAATIAN